MLKRITKFLSIFSVALTVFTASPSAMAAVNLPMQNIGDHGLWTTPENRENFVTMTTEELTAFRGNFNTSAGTVPIESKISLYFMEALSHVAKVLDNSLGRFVIVFMLVMYAFWIGLEAYTLIMGKSEVKKQSEEFVKKGALIAIWIVILNFGARDVFLWLVTPIISFSTNLSSMIYSAITEIAGAEMYTTCGAIRSYVASNASSNLMMDAGVVADILCIPATISGFCYSAIGVGWQWMTHGIGNSGFGFLAGLAFVIGFVCIAWKYAFVSLGVIADLFLSVMMLPFTAVAETLGKTSLKGTYGDVYNGFLKLFNAESLQKQLGRFINAAVFFVTFSIVIAFCSALLSGVVDFNTASEVPKLTDSGFVGAALTGALVWYLASKAEEISKKIGGEIDASMGEKTRGYVQEFTYNTALKVRKFFKKK